MKLDENILKACKGLVMNCNCKVLILDVLGEHRVFLVNDVHLKTRECRFNEVHDAQDITTLVLFKSGSGYSASWEVRNTTLCAMENQVKELTSLINELYEAREEIPTACTTEKDEADYQIKLLKTSIDNLNKFITLHRTALNKSIEDAVRWYGQTAPEWFTK